jgi:ribonuclease HI
VTVFTDSKYVIKAMTDWIIRWRKTGFNGIQNANYFKELSDALSQMKGTVEFKYVAGHSGVHGNEQADRLAQLAAKRDDSNSEELPKKRRKLS